MIKVKKKKLLVVFTGILLMLKSAVFLLKFKEINVFSMIGAVFILDLILNITITVKLYQAFNGKEQGDNIFKLIVLDVVLMIAFILIKKAQVYYQLAFKSGDKQLEYVMDSIASDIIGQGNILSYLITAIFFSLAYVLLRERMGRS